MNLEADLEILHLSGAGTASFPGLETPSDRGTESPC